MEGWNMGYEKTLFPPGVRRLGIKEKIHTFGKRKVFFPPPPPSCRIRVFPGSPSQ